MNKKKFRKVEPYIWMAPSMILMGIFIIIPIFVILRMSLSKVTRAGIVKEFTGFDNFLKVIHTSAFPKVLKKYGCLDYCGSRIVHFAGIHSCSYIE